MVSKLSEVKEVLGVLASDALLLDDHDEHVLLDQSPSDEDSSSEEDPLELELPATASTPLCVAMMRKTWMILILLIGAHRPLPN